MRTTGSASAGDADAEALTKQLGSATLGAAGPGARPGSGDPASSAARSAGRSARYATTPGPGVRCAVTPALVPRTVDPLRPQAYTPEKPAPGRFSIGARRSTSIEQEASSAAYVPGPGQYRNEARWDHVGSVKLGATAGRDKPVASVPGEVAAALRPAPVPGPGVRAQCFVARFGKSAHSLSFAGVLDAVVAL